nr:hypothetical protein [Skermanella rosea]
MELIRLTTSPILPAAPTRFLTFSTASWARREASIETVCEFSERAAISRIEAASCSTAAATVWTLALTRSAATDAAPDMWLLLSAVPWTTVAEEAMADEVVSSRDRSRCRGR